MNYFEILFVFQMKYVMLNIQNLVMECVIQKLLDSTVVTMMLEIVQVQDSNLKHFNFHQIGFIKRAVQNGVTVRISKIGTLFMVSGVVSRVTVQGRFMVRSVLRPLEFQFQVKNSLFMIISACGSLRYVMDGLCDDDNNFEECAWDGGDCCTDTKQVFCEVCYCHLDDL